MLNIEFYNSNYNNCLQNALSMIIRYYKMDPIYLHLCDWDFGYDNDKEKISDRILPHRDNTWYGKSIFNIMQVIYGLNTTVLKTTLIGEFAAIAYEQIVKGHPVIIETDIYNCTWHKSYMKYHLPHSFVVIDVKPDKFVCMASNMNSSFGDILFEKINIQEAKLMTFRISERKYEPNIDFISSLYGQAVSVLNKNNGQNDIERMILCSEDIVFYKEYEQDLKIFEDIWAIPLIRVSEWILWSRINYIELFERYLHTGKRKDEYINLLNKSKCNWNGIKNYLIKNALLNNCHPDMKPVQEMIKNAAKYEQDLAVNILGQ